MCHQARGRVAEAAISEAFREVSPVLPKGENALFLYSCRTGLKVKSEEEIQELIFDDMGRIAGYDNEKHHSFKSILAR